MAQFKKLTDEELNKAIGGVNWENYGKCLLVHGAGAMPALSELVAAVRAKDWNKVAVLSKQPYIASLPIVVECLSSN